MGIHFDSLPLRYKAFVSEWLISANASEAARKAGSRAKNIAQAGRQLLRKAEIQRAICEMQAQISEKLEITAENVLRELARIGFSDLRKAFNKSGNLKAIDSLDDDTVAAIASIKVVTSMDGDGVQYTKEIRCWDKRGALEALAKHLGLFDADNTQKRPMVIVKDFAGGHTRDQT
jgi:phage terminase small subunit